jgi:histidine triad (HIT) family protein
VSPADPACAFCRVVAGGEPGHVVLDEPLVVAFLDLRPLFPGHTLVVPRDHVPTLPDLPADQLAPYFGAVKRVATAVPAAVGAAGSFVAANNVVSQSVPHLHFHVVPRNPKDGLRGFFWPRRRYETEEEMTAVAAAIRQRLQDAVTM